MKPIVKIITTGVIVLAALGMVAYKYHDYTKYPWTRDGLALAQVGQIAPRVSGPLVRVPIQNNQLVKKGDLLFEIDPSTFQATVNLARAQFDNMSDIVKSLVEQVEGLKRTVEQREAEINEAKFEVEGSTAQVENARISLGRAKELIAENVNTQRDVDDKSMAYQMALAQPERKWARPPLRWRKRKTISLAGWPISACSESITLGCAGRQRTWKLRN
jgi:multidrug resistance efflux pump